MADFGLPALELSELIVTGLLLILSLIPMVVIYNGAFKCKRAGANLYYVKYLNFVWKALIFIYLLNFLPLCM